MPRASILPLAVLALLGAALPASAEEAPPLDLPAAVGSSARPVEPTAAARGLARVAENSLPSAVEGAADQLRSLQAWNAAHRLPYQNGFTRRLPAPLAARAGETLAAGARAATPIAPTGAAVWAARFDVDRGSRLRLHLEHVAVPSDTAFTIWGPDGRPRAFGLELLGPAGDIWSPSVGGGTAYLEVRWGAQSGAKSGFEIHELAELFAVEPLAGECLIDATCVSTGTLPSIAALRKAVAHVEFVDGGDTYVCSGGLLNDTDNATTALYFLTANHCISTQTVASSFEAFWDFKTASCDGAAPDIDTVPRSQGSTLLSTSVQSDYTLLRLASVPAGRTLLGWSSNRVPSGTKLSRISHPVPDLDIEPQRFSTQTYRASPQFTCDTDSDNRPWGDLAKFLYSEPLTGGTFGGSSGSPVVNPSGQVVGQLLGACGDNPEDGCSAGNYTVDGAFSATYPAIAQYLSPGGGGGSTCVPDGDTLCIDNAAGDRRFKVEVGFHTAQAGGVSGNGHAVALDSLGVTHGGLFWFFSVDNPELLIKVLNGCSANGKFWVFYSGATNVGMTITVTDTANGHTFVRTNADLHALATVQDTGALACN